jgi:hypothetical protein
MHRLRVVAVAGVIPWIPAVPPASVVPPLAAPCAVSSLHASLELQGATGSLAGGVILTNRGARPCSLLGPIRARFLGGVDRSGVRTTALARLRPEPATYPSLRSLRTGESAFVDIWWSNWCGTPPPARLALTLPAGELQLRVEGSARCDTPGRPSTLGVGPLQPRALPPPRGSHVPLAATIVDELHLGPKQVPGTRARAGGSAVFHVSLTNTSNQTFRFGATCPAYVEGTGLDQPAQLHLLNCHAVPTIPAGMTIVFEMRVRVPPKASGRIPLTWTLAPETEQPPFAGGVILVER